MGQKLTAKPLAIMKTLIGILLAAGIVLGGEPQTYNNPAPHPVVRLENTAPATTAPKNIILMIGDGMSLQHVQAAWLANGGTLNIMQCPVVGLSRTASASHTITDSAAGGTALASGTKAINKQLGLDPKGNKLDSLADWAKQRGMGTGIVTTKTVTDATPAAFYAHNPNRADEDAIALDLAAGNIDVIFGGGAKHFTQRKDGLNLLEQISKQGRTIKLATPGHYGTPAERGDILRQTSLEAVSRLRQNPNGYFLMIEGSKIDLASHANNLPETIAEMLDFDRTAGAILAEAAQNGDTLVIITADHECGGLSILDGDPASRTVTATFATGNHSGIAVPVYAFGPGSTNFTGTYENTAIPAKIKQAAAASR